MGTIHYGAADSPIQVDDLVLAHLKIVITTKLRRGESLMLSWDHQDDQPPGRSSIWLNPSVPLRFVFQTSDPPPLDRKYIEDLMNKANASGTIHLAAREAASRSLAGSRREPGARLSMT